MKTRHEAWLGLTKEEPFEPDLPICDCHHHLWKYPESLPEDRIPYYPRRFRHYILEDFLQDTAGGHNITHTICVESGAMYRNNGPCELRPVGETEFVENIATQSASGQYGNTFVASGIVGFADLTLGAAVSSVLEAHLTVSRDHFRGIRFDSTWDISQDVPFTSKVPDTFSSKKFREGFAQLHKYNLCFDAWLYFHQMPGLVELARSFPDTNIILDHIGAPLGIGPYVGKRDAVFQDWKQNIALVATCPNIVVKLGGMGMPERFGFDWHEMPEPPDSKTLAEDMAPYYLWCIEKFGTKRCMFESNFPVDKLSYSYTVLWNAFKRITKDFTPHERAELFRGTAVMVYRLKNNRF
jgi:L-fuconolactonase